MAKDRRMSTITDIEMKTLQKEFAGMDTDGNGDITVDELGEILRSMRLKLKLTDVQIKRVLKQIDSNGDGTVDSEELMEVLQKFDTDGIVYQALHHRSSIRTTFQKYDQDGSGFITKDEMVEIIKDRTGIKVPEKHLERMMQDCDKNDDNKINYEEFVTLMTKSCMQKRVF
jgi:Ca2+-binding EF-hand superfamily protein